MGILILFFLLALAIFFIPKYFQASSNSFLKTFTDKGSFGEYLTFSLLEKLTGLYRLLTNLMRLL